MLLEHIGDHSIIAVIGLCKNAGKTTTMCRLIRELEGTPIALTSVGRDGETTDLVTGTEKPEIWVSKGTLFGTARGLLNLCDVTVEVTGVTDCATPLGVVGVFRALSDGYIQLAGPSAVAHLAPLCRQFFDQGARRVIIDGAAGRKSLAGAGKESCAILCVGASLDPVMEKAVAETVHVCSLFAMPNPTGGLAKALGGMTGRFALFTHQGEPLPLTLEPTGLPNWAALPREDCVLWMDGGVTTPLLRSLSRRGFPLTLAVPDATHLLCDRASTETFFRRGGRFLVRRTIDIAAVAANPWSAYGHHYHEEDFLAALRAGLKVPVVNVKEDARCS